MASPPSNSSSTSTSSSHPSAPTATTNELLVVTTIDNKQYDLSQFKEYHPGGKLILEQYHEKDATEVFWAFHGPEAHERLSNLKPLPQQQPSDPSTSTTATVDPKIAAFRALRQKLKDEGYFKPNVYWQLYKCVTTVSLIVLGVVATWSGHWLLGSILFGIGYQQLGWLGHDACHHGLTTNRKFNNFLGYFFGNFLSGFSVNWWKDRHNTHHAITNVLDSDPDVDNLPLFVWSEHDITRALSWGGFSQSILPYQHLYFVPWTVTLKIIWCLQSVYFLSNLDAQNKSYKKSLFAEKATIVGHYIFLFCVMLMTPSFTAAITFLIVSEFIGGSGIALIVFMNHYACQQLQKYEGKDANFLQLQLNGTKNINPGIVMDWLAGGLNYQVEHHLFPTIPRHNLSKVKPFVEKFCAENSLPYYSYSYTECLMSILSRLHCVAGLYTQTALKHKKIE